MVQQLSKEAIIEIIHAKGGTQQNLLTILLELQNVLPEHCIDETTAQIVADELKMTETKVFEVLRFYAMTKDQPQATFAIKTCGSTPCHFTANNFTADTITNELGIQAGQQTADGLFSFEYVPCFGACDIAPAIKINEEIYGHMTAERFKELVAELRTRS